jgi:hypothetical protein
LAALAVGRLQKMQPGCSVASIFIKADIESNHDSAAKSILLSLNDQLCVSREQLKYAEQYRTPSRVLDQDCSMKSLLDELRQRVSGTPLSFLVIDDVHRLRIGSIPNDFLQEKLSELQSIGLNVLATSRIPFFREKNWFCDVKGCRWDRSSNKKLVSIYWICDKYCDRNYYICYSCKKEAVCLKW